jgi:hypothetical protein
VEAAGFKEDVMLRKASRSLPSLALIVFSTAALAAPAEKWLHVRVSDSGDKPETVRVNLPLTLVENLLPAIQEDHLQKGKLHLEGVKIDGTDMKAVVRAVRASRDGEFVTVEGGDDNVRVWKSGDTLNVRVIEGGSKPETVDVKVPLRLAEALFASEPGTVDLLSLIRSLKDEGGGEIVMIKDSTSHVRIWIDSRESSE